jgi:hypothetical protein
MLPVLLAAFAALLLIYVQRSKSGALITSSIPESPAGAQDGSAPSENYPPTSGIRTRPSASDVSITETDEASAEARQRDYVETRSAELAQLAMEDDSYSLQIILAELSNRNAEIRQAAREAAVQYGSAEAIPVLADSALQTDNPQEKVDIEKAIAFLKLPSITGTSAN